MFFDTVLILFFSSLGILQGGSIGLFPNDIDRLLQLGDEQDDATSPLAGFAEMKPQPDVQGHPGTMMAFQEVSFSFSY